MIFFLFLQPRDPPPRQSAVYGEGKWIIEHVKSGLHRFKVKIWKDQIMTVRIISVKQN